ncbi:DUF5324 family protein [Streptomyces sp. NPDC059837]|uniref:DUF5324 family protein n=1 Tax=unclassified Streptomyces TaxID=2593676 RepID=UPI0022532C7D|nr:MULTISPECIES: DUF5324 family protein [unclassified Streptomyces]MCX4408591.1 DUF5324 family protein [Streptomyces sp. NBC_01764]MCX5091488.1 DUF5324 family protein [Streptomyces sp. NBC_00365]MCX5185836.1 DUF5324 family protein [Streptomyces sp. NBC_00268]
MTRIDSVRAATGSAKDSVLHAAEVVAPYADTAKDRASYYANEARVRLAPKVSLAAEQARVQYGAHLAPRLEQARTHVPPKVDQAAHTAAVRTRQAAAQAADYTKPRIEQAVAASQPVREEAASRGAAAIAALRGQVSPKEIQKLVRRQQRRAKAGRIAKGLAVVGILAGGAFAAWKWWDKQANPDWLVEPPAATEVPETGRLSSVDGTDRSELDPEVQAKQAEDEAADRDDLR